ncbi:MAG: hypothetical protein GY862_22660 [Gammaproteobacteria bacterium]|nr:hypothetical protein [Gammaproteobacteria bacterium]
MMYNIRDIHHGEGNILKSCPVQRKPTDWSLKIDKLKQGLDSHRPLPTTAIRNLHDIRLMVEIVEESFKPYWFALGISALNG